MKSILAAILVVAAGFAAATVRADDLPFGFSVVSETPQKGETARSKILNKEKELVGRKITKDDGTSELHTFVKGVRTQKIIYAKDGSRLSEFLYYPDGKMKRETRKGVLRFERRQLADGTFEAIRYKPDGIRPQMRRRVGPNGAFELIHYRTGKSTAVYFTTTLKGASGDMEWQYFATDGSQLRRVMQKEQMVVTVYNPVGNFKLEQIWTKKDGAPYTIKSVAVPHNSGYRRYTFDASGAVINVEDVDSDGSVTETWKPAQVAKPDAGLLKEQFEDDDPTLPEADE